jgi:hypothetical protein
MEAMEELRIPTVALPGILPCSEDDLLAMDEEGDVRDELVGRLVSLKSLLRLDEDGIVVDGLEAELRAYVADFPCF